MRESSYYAKINKYYTKNARTTIAWEAKFTKGSSIPFSDLQPHQEEKLLEAERVLAHKEPDVGIHKKSFDGYVLFHACSYFIAIFYKPGGTVLYEIPIRDFIKEKYSSDRKSLTQDRARELASAIIVDK